MWSFLLSIRVIKIANLQLLDNKRRVKGNSLE